MFTCTIRYLDTKRTTAVEVETDHAQQVARWARDVEAIGKKFHRKHVVVVVGE